MTTTSPRATSSRSTPVRFSATRWPACARSTGSSWTSTPRTRAVRPLGRIVTVSPRPALPDHSVPVTTVPAPRIVNTRSTCSRVAPGSVGARGGAGGRAVERRAQLVEPLAGAGRDRDDLGSRQQLLRLGAGPGRIGEVGLRDRHDADLDAERPQHGRVLARLRHHAVVGGEDHQVQVDPGRSRDHRAHEPLVTGNVDDREPPPRRQHQRRIAERDRDPALALLGQAVGVDAGERLDQRGLAVIDVAGGSERGHDRPSAGSTSSRTTASTRSRRYGASAAAAPAA